MKRGLSACEVVAIGDELLLGETVDGNGAWLGRTLAAAGVPVARRAVVGDDAGTIAGAVAEALTRTGCVICSGGLGPTSDDRTKPAVADLFGRTLVLDEAWLEVMRARFAERGIELNELSRSQALVPEGSTVFANARGSAPGIALEDGRGVAILLPGVPHELRGLVEDHVLPFLLERAGSEARPVRNHLIRTTGIAESVLADRIGDLVERLAPLTVAFLPSARGVDVRLTLRGGAASDAEARFADAERAVRARVARHVYATGDLDLASAIGHELADRGLTMAVAESCTGGLLSTWITDASGASASFLAGLVTYSNEAKCDLLGVDQELIARHGAVSDEVARAMAEGARARTGADCSMAVTGIAGPGGGTPEKPVGTVWIAASLGTRTETRLLRLRGDRAEIRQRSAQSALFLLREMLAELAGATTA